MDSPKLKMKDMITLPNIAEKLSQDYLESLGTKVLEDYHTDLKSRVDWETRNRDAIKLALQVVEKKTTPFVGASNVKFPLVTIAALQFLSRISILTRGRKIVQCDVLGVDHEGKETERAKRISAHMSYQIVEEDINWIDDDERTKFSTSILGSGFKKTYHDTVSGMNISEFVPAYNFVVDYYTKFLDGKGRSTHIIPMSENDILERVRRGVFLKDEESQNPSVEESSILKEVRDKAQGVNKPANNNDSPSQILEQYVWLDLDGDEYKEPYIVSVRQSNGRVLRVVANYYDEGDVHRVNDAKILTLKQKRIELITGVVTDIPEMKKQLSALDKQISELEESKDNLIVRIDPVTYFTKYVFLPSPDGGFYGLGLGSLLGPVNAAVDTGINQLIDAASLANRSGGVLGRGVKLRSGNLELDKWTPVDSNGDDIRKNVMQWPVREPSGILFQLVQLLISYGERITGATDIMTGVAPGQNTPAETSRNTIEQGMKIFSGIYQRMHRSFQEELRKWYRLNTLYMGTSAKFIDLSTGKGAIISIDDYRKGDVIVKPSADPSTASDAQRQQKAVVVSQRADANPLYNKYQTERNFLESFDINNIETILPDPAGPKAVPPPVNPKVQIEQMKLQMKQAELQQQSKTDEFEMEVKKFELQQEVQMQEANILKLMAEVDKLRAEAKGVETGHQIALIEAQIGAARIHRESIMKALDLISKQRKDANEQKQRGMADSTGNTKVSGGNEAS
jgi:chaperonin GroES